MRKKMYLITKEYPFGRSEASFIEPEYQKLLKEFDITIIATEVSDKCTKKDDHDSIKIDLKISLFGKFLSFIRFLRHKEAWDEFWNIIIERNDNILKNLVRACMYGTYAEVFFCKIRKKLNLKKNTSDIFYFYWWDYKCLGLTMHHKKKLSNIKIIARTHGYDLYDERELYGRQYFKRQMDEELERLIFVAQYGKKYYLSKYCKQDSEKYPVHCLGVKDPKIDLSIGMGKEFHIVSCSNVIPLKRVDLIIEGLSLINDINIKWVHIGAGIESEKMQQLARQKLANNVQYEFLGRLENSEVIEYYRRHNVNCFITTTSTEGNPVSVQEALSFGIPVIATNVSDIPRMIDHNGVLLSENPTGIEIANAIRSIAHMGYNEYHELRVNSYKIFSRDYNEEKNYQELLEDLMKLFE